MTVRAAWKRAGYALSSTALLVISVAAMSMIGGCASAPTDGKQGGYAELYAAGKYPEAQDAAAAVAKAASGSEKERAQLIAGLAAHARDHDYDAEPYLRPLVDSSDKTIAGRAGAAMGLIAQRAGRHAKATELLTTASAKLEGDQSARAMLYAGDSFKALGEDSKARDAYAKAAGLTTTDTTLKNLIASRLAPPPPATSPGIRSDGKFTLQVGAYGSRQRAQATADKLRELATKLGMGSPRVVETRVKGKSVTVVQIGRFATQKAAELAKQQVGSGAFVTLAD